MKHKKTIVLLLLLALFVLYVTAVVQPEEAVIVKETVKTVEPVAEPAPVELPVETPIAAPAPQPADVVVTVTVPKTETNTRPTVLAESEIESIVNNTREANGLHRLLSNAKLRNSACAKAQHMLDNQYWAHTAPDGTEPWYFITKAGYSYSEAGENLATGFTTASSTVDGWMNSPTHRDNMLNSIHEDQGICSVSGDFIGSYRTITVQHLGAQ